ncbi:MAG: hypothetical protein J6C46_02830 [Clostridia bacterium]|nr:hypothetical protein [Clostridia bacterium]
MKVLNLSEAVEKLEKTDLPVKLQDTKKKEKAQTNTSSNKADKVLSQNRNLPQVRKVALAKRRVAFVMLVALFISCFSLSVFVGYFGPFLLFK